MSSIIAINEKSRKEDMLLYDAQHRLEECENYGFNLSNNTDRNTTSIANYLHDNFHKIDNEEMSFLLNKCLSLNDKKRFLLEYELKNYKETPCDVMTLQEFSEKASSILKRYSWRAGGFLLEDRIWTKYEHGAEGFEIKENEIVFQNSVDKGDLENFETRIFLRRIVNRLNGICPNIKVKLEHKLFNSIIWLMLWVVDNKDKKKGEILIDL